MIKLSRLEKKLLLDHEDDFDNLNINEALINLINDLYSDKWVQDNIDYIDTFLNRNTSFGRVLSFLSDGSDLLNEIDESVYECFKKQHGAGAFYVTAGPDTIINPKMKTAWIRYDFDIKLLSLPEATSLSRTIKYALIFGGVNNHTKIIDLPKLNPLPNEEFHIVSSAVSGTDYPKLVCTKEMYNLLEKDAKEDAIANHLLKNCTTITRGS